MAVQTWPSLLPNVQRAGNARMPVDLTQRSSMPLGAPQARQRFNRPRETCPVSMILDANGLAFFDAYWHWYLNQGCAWVTIPLRGELGTAATYARFIGGYQAVETGGKWTVTMTAELENPPHTAGLLVCQDPTFSPPAGVLQGTTSLTIASGTSGATIYYTVDGSTPTRSSTLYTGPVSLVGTAAITVKALAVKTGYEDSLPASATYTFATCATPVVSPGTGLYTSTQSVSISCTTVGVTIYYTTNGTTPTTGSTLYTGAFNVSASTTVKALAVKASLFNSAIGTAALSFPATGALNAITFDNLVETGCYLNGILYVGGSFATVHDAAGNHSRARLAAIDVSTGLVTAWNPGADNTVLMMRADSAGRLWVSGKFATVSSVARALLARFDTSQVIDSFASGITSGTSVDDFDFDPVTGGAYAVGLFSAVGGVTHKNFAAYDGSDVFRTASPSVDGTIARGFCVRCVGGIVYIAGTRTTNSGLSLDSTTLAASSWAVATTSTNIIFSMAQFGSIWYMAGGLAQVQGTARNNAAAVDMTASAALQSWNPNANATAECIAADPNGVVYIVGNFTTIGGSSRNGAAAFDTSGAIKTGWNPGLTSLTTVNGVIVAGPLVFLFGQFANPSAGSNMYALGIA